MLKNIKFVSLCCLSGLTGCASMYHPTYYTATTPYQPYVYQNTQFYPRQEKNIDYSRNETQSYHVSSYHSPTSHKDIDSNWVNRQNPHGYTIEIGTSEKAAEVAAKLHKVPKNNRVAEIKTYQNGKYYYKGVYGNYSNYNEAQKAFNNLPSDLKQAASIKSWGKVRGNSGY